MKTFSKYFAFLVIFLSIAVQCLATQNLNIYNQSQNSDNYYVKAGGVYVAPNEIFVLFDGELIQVNILCADERGVFVPSIEMSRKFEWCPICQHWYDPDKPHYCR